MDKKKIKLYRNEIRGRIFFSNIFHSRMEDKFVPYFEFIYGSTKKKKG